MKVEISGKAYDINSLEKEDIVVEATGSYVGSTGSIVLTLTARVKDGVKTSGPIMTKVTPSSVKAYFDYRITEPINVEARLKNDMKNLVADEFSVGTLGTTMTTVDVEGPAAVINNLTKVYFEAEISEDALPLTETKEVPATLVYQFDGEYTSEYLTCKSLNDENPAAVIIPVFVSKDLNTAVKFGKAPDYYNEVMPELKVYPEKVTVLYSSKEQADATETFYVGTIDFTELSNKVNYFEFPIDNNLGMNIVDETIEKFTVSVDMSDKSMITLNKTPGKKQLQNQDENYIYNIDYEKSELDKITVVGPWDKLQKLTEDDLQIDIDVKPLDLTKNGEQVVEVSKISIVSDGYEDCWVYGKYNAYISVEPKE